jgi:hypothetical protein
MMAAVERIDITHTALNARINCIEGGHRVPQVHPLAQGRRRQGDNDAVQGSDLI